MVSRRTTLRLAVYTMVCALGVACTANEAATTTPTTGPSEASAPLSTATAPAVTLTRPNARFAVSIRQLGGGVKASSRARLRRAIGAPVSAWFEHGFLGAHYPTGDFPAAFRSWTRGAAHQATRDEDLTTNASLGPDLVAVVADNQRASLFVFASKGVTGGATARVRLAMTGEKRDGSWVHEVVSGELYLTRDKRRWSIFGYDLQRSLGAS